MQVVKTKKELSTEQREELLSALQGRFERNMNRHKGLEWAKVRALSWRLILRNCGHSVKWKELAANRMLSVMIEVRANTSFLIAQRKVLTAAEVFVTTVKDWIQGKNINRNITLLIWRLPWTLSF